MSNSQLKVIWQQRSFFSVIIVLLILITVGCSKADTLGGEDPDEVIITGTPTWENGIKRLVGLKCAVCHTVPTNDLTPNNAPKDLNLKEYHGNENFRGAEILGIWINAGILENKIGSVRQMPLEYATPLTQQEITSLRNWAESGTPEN